MHHVNEVDPSLFRRYSLQPPKVSNPTPNPLNYPSLLMMFWLKHADYYWLWLSLSIHKTSLVLHFPLLFTLFTHMDVISASLSRRSMSPRLSTPVKPTTRLSNESSASHIHWKAPHFPASMLTVCNEVMVFVSVPLLSVLYSTLP